MQQLTLTGETADADEVKARELSHVESSSIDEDDPVHYRETYTDLHEDEVKEVSVTYRVETVRPTRRVAIYGRQGNRAVGIMKVHIEDVDVSDLSRCVECRELKTYDGARCDWCDLKGGDDDGE